VPQNSFIIVIPRGFGAISGGAAGFIYDRLTANK
jgi:hypothetical protein